MAAEIRSVGKVGKDQWLEVVLERFGRQSLPYGLKVLLETAKGGRQYFTVLEGVYKGEKGSVHSAGVGNRWFENGLTYLPGGMIRFNLALQALWVGRQGPYSAFSGAFTHPTNGRKYTAVAPGKYQLCIPDAPHSATRREYYKWARFHKSWFLIDNYPGDQTDSRYFHSGEISEGCVTVRAYVVDPRNPTAEPGFTDMQQWLTNAPGGIGMPYPKVQNSIVGWDLVYNYLILRRSDDQHVGTLTVE
jgi:hypothetical protein